jgi:hypothetical protein
MNRRASDRRTQGNDKPLNTASGVLSLTRAAREGEQELD